MSTIDKIARAARLESALLVSRMLLAGRDDQKPTQDGRQRHWGTGHTKAELHCWAPGNRPPLTRSPPVHPASHTAARAARRATRKQVEYSRLATAQWPSCSWQHDASSTFFSGDSFSSSSNVYQRSPPPRRAPSTRATPPSHHAAPVLVLHLHRGVTVSVAHQSQHQEQQQLGLHRHSAHRRAPQRASPNVESSQLAPHLASPSGEMSSWMVPRADQPETILLRVIQEGDGPRKDDHPLPPSTTARSGARSGPTLIPAPTHCAALLARSANWLALWWDVRRDRRHRSAPAPGAARADRRGVHDCSTPRHNTHA
jgi:hypothetical protein